MTTSIGLGEFRVGRPEGPEWVMHGLGSCIGLILADRLTHVSAAAHIVLPTGPGKSFVDPTKYADRAVPFLLTQMRRYGGKRESIHAMMAGGARMFDVPGLADIGQRNAEAVRNQLEQEGIPLIAADVGGNRGRTLWWNPSTGVARITRVGAAEVVLTPDRYRFDPVVRLKAE